jgi:hypothetical protein
MYDIDSKQAEQQSVQWQQLRVRLRKASFAVPEKKYHEIMCALAAGLSCYARVSIRRDFYTCSYGQNSEIDFLALSGSDRFRSMPRFEDLPWIEVLYLEESDCYALRCDILFDGYSLGSLQIIRPGTPFCLEEAFLADYAALLCSGFNQFFDYGRSHQIHMTLRAAYRGEALPADGLALFPAQGYALILHDNASGECRAIGDDPDSNDFLVELFYAYFGESTFSTFRKKNSDILLFAETDDIRGYVQELTALLKRHRREPYIGISSLQEKGKLPHAFSEARRALEIGRRLSPAARSFFFDELGFYRYFTYPESTVFVDRALAQLHKRFLTCTPEKRETLLETLGSFIRNGFNYYDAAEELFTHPNTVRYRITQVESLLGIDLRSREDRLAAEILWQMYLLQGQNGEGGSHDAS